MSQLSDELLVAYIDGQLDERQASSMTRLISEDSDLAQRVRRFQHTQSVLIDVFGRLAQLARRGAFEQMIAPPRVAPEHQGKGSSGRTAAVRSTSAHSGSRRCARGGRAWVGRVRILSLALGIALLAAVAGYVAARYLRDKPPAAPAKIVSQIPAAPKSWAEDIGLLHSFFTRESVAVAPESQQNPELVRFQLSKIANRPISIPDFQVHGLSFRRGQILSYRGSELMQLTYYGKDQPLVGLYIMPGGPDTRPFLGSFADLKTISWSADGVRYVIAGRLAENALRALAAVAQNQISKD